MSSKRIFLALPIAPNWRKAFEHYRDRHGDIPYLRWTPLANLHVTTLFLGDADEEVLSEVRVRAKAAVAGSSGFALSLERVQYAPPESRARMVWAYLTPENAFIELVLELARTMSEIPMGLDDLKRGLLETGADISPHVTLARFRSDLPYPRELRRLLRTEREGELLHVSEIILFESLRGHDGRPPEYRMLDTFSLGA